MRIGWSGEQSVSAVERGTGDWTVVLAHGAGTDQHHPMIVGIAEALVAVGLRVVTFNYPYTEMGRRRPDRTETLLTCHRAVVEAVRSRHGERLVLAGRSMGGRMGTMLAAEETPSRGVIAYAYPLHPAGRPDRLRIDHLSSIQVPQLFFQGSRDALSRPDLFDRHVRPLASATVVDMPGADHSFRGRDWKPERMYPFLAEHTAGWMRSLD